MPTDAKHELMILTELQAVGYTNEAHRILAHYERDTIKGRMNYARVTGVFNGGNEDMFPRLAFVLAAYQGARQRIQAEWTATPEMWVKLAEASVAVYPFRYPRRAA